MERLKISFTMLFATLAIGTLGFHIIEDMSFFDSFYMTVITISTVGYGEIKPLSMYGRIHAMIIISFGITTGAYTIGNLLRMFVEGELKKTFWRKKVEKKIEKLRDHYIICGFGRIGSLICEEMAAHQKEYVVLETDPARLSELEKKNMLFLPADATTDEALVKAGIMKAAGIVTAVRSDADNVFITLSAKAMRPDIFVVARSSDEKSETKLKMAGASRVVSPYIIGGKRMAQIIIRPTVVDFIDIASMGDNLGLMMEEATIKKGSQLIGKSIIESHLRKEFGVIIVLIKKINGAMIFNPAPAELLDENDVMVLLGKKDDLKRMSSVV